MLDEKETEIFQWLFASNHFVFTKLDYDNMDASVCILNEKEKDELLNLNWNRYVECLSFSLWDLIKFKLNNILLYNR
jgi:hypothetical protein